MKSKKIITFFIVVLLIIAIAVAGIVLAESSVQTQALEEKNRTSVLLVPEKYQNGEYTGKVDVYLEMDDGMQLTDEEKEQEGESTIIKDAASVASFQIGLDISTVAPNKDITSIIDFEYDKDLKEGKDGVQLATYTQAPVTQTQDTENGEEVTTVVGEKLNLYFVGTKELNDNTSSAPLKVGTIKFDKNSFSDNTAVFIKPEEEATLASSVGHEETEIIVNSGEDAIEFILNNDSSNNNSSSGNTGNTTGDENTAGEDNTTDDENTAGEGSLAGDGNTVGNGSTGGNSNQGQNGNSGNSGNGSSGGAVSQKQNQGSTSSSGKNTGNKSIVDRIISGIKTGANHSVTHIVVILVVLVFVAIGIMYLKAKNKGRRSKH